MNMPVDISEVFKIATDMKEVASTPITVSIHIDDSAPGALVGHVRSAFASAGEHTRVTIEYLDDARVEPKEGEDMAVIVAGAAAYVGEAASALRHAGVPTMVVTSDPASVADAAHAAGHAIPAADIVAPVKLQSVLESKVFAKIPFVGGKAADAGKDAGAADVTAAAAADDGAADGAASPAVAVGDDAGVGAIPLDDETLKVLDARMGKWIIAAVSDKDLAFALSFPFVRRPLAMEAITATSLQNGAVGLVPFIPGADMPIMTLNQIKMVLQIATAYGQPLDKDRIKEIVAVVAGAFICRNIVRSATKAIPFAGWLISGGMGFAATEAMGRAMLEYFEAGGDIVGVASVMQTARDAAMDASKQAAASPLGKSVVAKAREAASQVLSAASSK